MQARIAALEEHNMELTVALGDTQYDLKKKDELVESMKGETERLQQELAAARMSGRQAVSLPKSELPRPAEILHSYQALLSVRRLLGGSGLLQTCEALDVAVQLHRLVLEAADEGPEGRPAGDAHGQQPGPAAAAGEGNVGGTEGGEVDAELQRLMAHQQARQLEQQALKQENEQLRAWAVARVAEQEQLQKAFTDGLPDCLRGAGAGAAPMPAGQQPVPAAAGPAPHLHGGGQPEAVAVGPPHQLRADQQPVAGAGGAPRRLVGNGQPEAVAGGAVPQPPADQQLQLEAEDGQLSCVLNNGSAVAGGPLVSVLCLKDLRLQRADLRKASHGMKGAILADARLDPDLVFERATLLVSGLSPTLCPVIMLASGRRQQQLHDKTCFEISRKKPEGGDTPQLRRQFAAACNIFHPQRCSPTDSLTLLVQYSDGSQHSLKLVRSQGGDIVVADA